MLVFVSALIWIPYRMILSPTSDGRLPALPLATMPLLLLSRTHYSQSQDVDSLAHLCCFFPICLNSQLGSFLDPTQL